jgi:hypothetical protein
MAGWAANLIQMLKPITLIKDPLWEYLMSLTYKPPFRWRR